MAAEAEVTAAAPPQSMIGLQEAWPRWDAQAMTSALNLIQDYRSIIPLLRKHVDEYRDGEAVTWAEARAEEGHVPIAVHVVRNVLKTRSGPVPNQAQVRYAFRIGLLSIVRTVQDVTVLRRSMGHVVGDDVYLLIRDKIGGWMGQVSRWLIPKLADVARELSASRVLSEALDIAPYWVESVHPSWTAVVGGGHVEYDRPALVSINAWNRSSFDHVRRDRVAVAEKVLAQCETIEWGMLLKMDLEDLVGRDIVGGGIVEP